MFTKLAEKLGLLNVIAPESEESKKRVLIKERQQKKAEAEACRARQKERQAVLQKQREAEAAAKGFFIPKQQVKYFDKINNCYYDATIIGMHLDDGPDKPYYTIKYRKPFAYADDEGNEKVEYEQIEKQTDADRLSRI